MGTSLNQASAVREFATAIGEWLLTQRFGVITPLAFRYDVWEERHPLPGELPTVTFELVVTDPPPPPPEWHRLKSMRIEDMSPEEAREWTRGQLWPRADMDAVEEAAIAHARALGIPEGIAPYWPVRVVLLGRSEVRERDFPPVK